MPSRLCKGYRHSFKSFLRSVSESKLTDSHLNLTAGDGDGGARGEARDDGLGDEVDEEAEPEVAADEDNDRHGNEQENKQTNRRLPQMKTMIPVKKANSGA